MPEIYAWDVDANNNDNPPPHGAPENMEYAEVNNTIREMMAVLKRFFTASLSGVPVTAGTQPAYTLVSGQTISAYAAGQLFSFTAHATASGNITLNVDGLGAGNVVNASGAQLGAGDFTANGVYLVVRRAGDFQLVGGAGGGAELFAPATTGTQPTYVLTTGTLTAYQDGQVVLFRIHSANAAGAATLNVDGLGASALEDHNSVALVANELVVNNAYLAVRTASEWRIIAGLQTSLTADVTGVLPVANGGTGQGTEENAMQAFIAALSQVTPAADDLIPFGDTSDSGNAKKARVDAIGAGKQSIWIPAGAMEDASAQATRLVIPTSFVTIDVLAFDSAVEEFGQFRVAMPKGWNESTLSFKAFWVHSSAVTNFGVAWGLGAIAFSDTNVLTTAFPAETVVTDTGGAVDTLYITAESGALTVSNTPAEQDLVCFDVVREVGNAGDTLAADAYLVGIMLYLTTNANTDV